MKENLLLLKRSITALKSKIFKYMISISKNVNIDKLDDILNKYNNTYHRTITMKPADVKSNTYVNSSKKVNDKDLKFKFGDIVTISKYNNIFAKGYAPNWYEEDFVINKSNKKKVLNYMLNGKNTIIRLIAG